MGSKHDPIWILFLFFSPAHCCGAFIHTNTEDQIKSPYIVIIVVVKKSFAAGEETTRFAEQTIVFIHLGALAKQVSLWGKNTAKRLP